MWTQAPEKTSWTEGLEALEDALKTEAAVTKSIKQVIQKCEDDDKNNDYHVRQIRMARAALIVWLK